MGQRCHPGRELGDATAGRGIWAEVVRVETLLPLAGRGALLHIFRVASSPHSMAVGEPQVVAQVEEAWKQARKAGTTGRFLDAVLQKALAVSKRARTETAIGKAGVSILTPRWNSRAGF